MYTYSWFMVMYGRNQHNTKEVTLQLKVIYGKKLYTHTDTESLILTYIQMTSVCRHSINLSTK